MKFGHSGAECPYCPDHKRLSWNSIYPHMLKAHFNEVAADLASIPALTGNLSIDMYRLLTIKTEANLQNVNRLINKNSLETFDLGVIDNTG